MGGVLISLVEIGLDILTVLEVAVAVDRAAFTADEPPATDDCSAVYVWGIRLYDSGNSFSPRGDDPTCLVRRTYEYGYRLDVCRKVRGDGKELTPAEYLADATTFGDKVDAVFCALAEAKVNKTMSVLLDACEDIQIGDLIIDSAQGDRISATGTLKVTYPCQPTGS